MCTLYRHVQLCNFLRWTSCVWHQHRFVVSDQSVSKSSATSSYQPTHHACNLLYVTLIPWQQHDNLSMTESGLVQKVCTEGKEALSVSSLRLISVVQDAWCRRMPAAYAMETCVRGASGQRQSLCGAALVVATMCMLAACTSGPNTRSHTCLWLFVEMQSQPSCCMQAVLSCNILACNGLLTRSNLVLSPDVTLPNSSSFALKLISDHLLC